MGLRHVQFVADLLNPFLPEDYVEKQLERTLAARDRYGLSIDSVFTSAYTRVNHLMHPDPEARRIWLDWFKRFFAIGARLGAKNGGSHFGILSFDTYENPDRRERMVEEGVRGWQELSIFARDIGFECLIFEPMSVPREMGNTVEETLDLMARVNAHCGVPLRLCLDIGHAPHPDQRDPYPWLERLGAVSPVIHLQQTVMNKSQHWPFTPEYNAQGIIEPTRVLAALERSGCREALLTFELGHREHWDTDTRVIADHRASVEHWKPCVPV
jgi:sugar phosphate isomerase/epimerase